jgi:outer membrane lipoprotein-sorting protein
VAVYPGMQYYLKKSWTVFFCFIILVLSHAALNAYVLPGPYLLKLMTQHFGIGDRLLVTQKLLIYDADSDTGLAEFNETLKFVFPETLRADIDSEKVQRIHILSKDGVLTVIDGKISDASENLYDHYTDLLLFRSRKSLQQRLLDIGVNVQISSLGRFQGKTAYVLGAQYPDEDTPQVWLDKNTFRPCRWIMTRRPGQRLEVLYLNWQAMNKAWYPMHIEFFFNGNLVREIYVQDIKVNPSFPADIFNIQELKSQYPQHALSEPENKANEDMDEVQKTIEDFKKIYK